MKKTLLIVLFICTKILYSQNPEIDKIYHIKKLLTEFSENEAFSGTVLIASKGESFFQESYGIANRDWNIKMENNTKFVIGSISKSMTSTLVVKLAQEKKLNLEDPILKYFPEFSAEKYKNITIHHLISNTSGIPNYFLLDGWIKGNFNKYFSKEEFLKEIEKLDLFFEPGESYHYSNSNYFLLSLIIEKVTNLPFEKAIDKHLFFPLKMENTGVYHYDKIVKNLASGYRFSKNGGYRNQNYINYFLFNGAGNIYSTAEDLLKFEQLFYSDNYLNKTSKKILFNPKYRNGWNVEEFKFGNEVLKNINYDGQIEGYSTMLYRFPEENLTIILLANNGIGYEAKKYIIESISKIIFLGKPKEKTPFFLALNKAVYEDNLDVAIENFEKNKDKYSKHPELISDLAKQLSWSGLTEKAEKIYLFDHKLFPNDINLTFEIAEFYKENNEIKKAIPFYKIVQKEYPENNYINSMLKEKD
ncbi:serine hydrolase domain-containing protein [Aureivirga sp. CE67]|uniref:serine hydrolase domain-containing protein n=1 Tax=Aureivirga sp. CE67 TaxID=1788983 RepID=UPI0018C91C96|nr:serine hydrolase domain-containing protein [Aureivirga sp. CE67]